MAYRSTPHFVTGRSPAELLFNRQIRTKLPELSANNQYQPTGQDAAVRRKRWVQPEPDTVVPIGVAGERLVSHSTAPVETHEQDTRPQRTRRMPTHFVDYRLDRQCHKGAE